MIEIVPMAEEHIDGVVTLEEATFSIPWTRADFEREVRENTMAIYYVALMDGRVVGYAGMWHVVTEGHITNVGVLEEVRCEGIGSMLMEKLIEKALEKEMTGITLEVRMGNRPAQALYHKYGFRQRASVRIITPTPRRMQLSCGNISPMQRVRPFDGAEKKK